jgi:hypothetical protein
LCNQKKKARLIYITAINDVKMQEKSSRVIEDFRILVSNAISPTQALATIGTVKSVLFGNTG